jgi:hypothetical protein
LICFIQGVAKAKITGGYLVTTVNQRNIAPCLIAPYFEAIATSLSRRLYHIYIKALFAQVIIAPHQ